MQDWAESFTHVVNRYFESKTNSLISLSVAAGTASTITTPIFYVVVNGQTVFNYTFLYQSIGTAFISMQIIFLLYKFYRWLREL